MTQPEAPVRWLSRPDELPSALTEALVAYQDQAPPAAERDAMFAGLEARLSAAEGTLAAPKLLRLRRLGYLAVLGGLAAVLAVVLSSPMSAPRPAPRAEHVAASAPAAATEKLPETKSHSGLPVNPAEVTKSPASAPIAPPARLPGKTRTQPAAPDPSAELALLTAARRVLLAAPARSLALTAEHARRFPRGSFAEERDLLRIEALLQSGQREAAARHARRFRAAYPHSAHLDGLAEAFAP